MSSSSEYVLEMIGITKQFPGVRALDDVTIRVRRGEIHGLIGENGAGKSTLMKILEGVYPTGSYQGEILLDGAPVMLRSPHDARIKGVGYVPQEISVIEALSVAENIWVGRLAPHGVLVRFRELYERTQRLLKECNIRLDPRLPVAALTVSQRQLVMIARALSTEPSVLILDEPTASLTQDETANLFRILRHLQAQGVTSIFITHKLEELFEMADRVTVLRDGAVTAHFERDAYSRNDIITAMVGRKIESLYPERAGAVGGEALRVENLTVPHPRIARRNVAAGVSFAVHAGEILGIAGLVGSGRSEVVNAIYGRLPYRGRIFVEGRPVRIRSPQQANRNGIALLTEERKREGLLFNFTIGENITLGDLRAVSHFGVMDRKRERHYARDYMERLAVRAPSAATMPAALSGGNQQKVVLAKALMTKPKILLLDEPTKGVDVGAKFEIYKLMGDLVRQGMALVVISSELPELLGMCDRFIVLAGGKVTDRFTRAEAGENRVMTAATGDSPAAGQSETAAYPAPSA